MGTPSKERCEKMKLETLLHGSLNPIVIFKGKEMLLEMFNESYQEIYYGRDLLGKKIFDVITELRDSPFPEILNKVYESGESYTTVEGCSRILNQKTGELEERYFDTTFSRLDWGDGCYRILAMPREVTEKMKYKKLLESNIKQLEEEKEWREFFVSTVTHDLINPLSVINLLVDLLKRKTTESAELNKIAEKMKLHVTKAKKMAKDLLDVNRLEAREWPALDLHYCCLRNIVLETVQSLTEMYPQRIQVKILNESLIGLWDQLAINRILNNLVSNAIKYGQDSSPVTIELARTDHDRVSLSIHNWGDPISAEDQQNIFKKYHRGTKLSGSKKRGWGIGLTLVKGLTEAQKGTIHLISSQTAETTFVVKLPIVKS